MDTIRTCISFLASSAGKTIARLSRERLSCFGVTPIQFAVLQMAFESKDATASEIGAGLSIDSATIVGVIDRLEKLDLLRRTPVPGDRRAYRLVLTGSGLACLPEMQAAMDAFNAEVDAMLGAAAGHVRQNLSDLSRLTLDHGKS